MKRDLNVVSYYKLEFFVERLAETQGKFYNIPVEIDFEILSLNIQLKDSLPV